MVVVVAEYTVTINNIPYIYNTPRGLSLSPPDSLEQLHVFSKQKNIIQYLRDSFSGVNIEIGNVEYIEDGEFVQVKMFSEK